MKSIIITILLIAAVSFIAYKIVKEIKQRKMEKLKDEMNERINRYAISKGVDYRILQSSVSGNWSLEDMAVIEAHHMAEIDKLSKE